MAAAAHVYEIFIRASRERVWQALTAENDTVRYFHGTRFESTFEPGAPFVNRIVAADQPAADGVIEVFEPPSRLVYTWHVLYDAAMSEEAPGRVEWVLTPANGDGSVTRVTVRHGALALSPLTWEHVRLGWVEIIDGLKTWLETGEALPGVDIGGGDVEATSVQADWHRAQAIEANNSTWEFLDGRDHSADEADELLERAYAASHHWRRAAGTGPVNLARASWLISRAHATLGHGEVALHHAEQCAAHAAAAGDDAADFDHAYALEAQARALAALGRVDEATAVKAEATAFPIADDEDRSIVEADLAAGPWFGTT